MAPNIKENEITVASNEFEKLVAPQAGPRKYEFVYQNIAVLSFFHFEAIYGLYLCFTSAKWATIYFNSVLYVATGLGVTAGAHRLWSHRTYKAKLPLQIILMLFNSLAFQYSVTHWARDHRLHHKYSDTDADPHNATRGFFYSHIGWLFVKKHPEAIKRGKTIDISDLKSNPVLQFQNRYFVILTGTIAFLLPTLIPMYFWGETLATAFHASVFRIIIALNATFLVNSAAHMFGNKPYDKNILPGQSIRLSLATLGECFHNYHHVFPFDYRTSEMGNNYINLTTKFIDFFAWIGWAYDLKTATEDMIVKRTERTGDGTDLWGRVNTDVKAESSTEDGI